MKLKNKTVETELSLRLIKHHRRVEQELHIFEGN
jgi:hypothetical protein